MVCAQLSLLLHAQTVHCRDVESGEHAPPTGKRQGEELERRSPWLGFLIRVRGRAQCGAVVDSNAVVSMLENRNATIGATRKCAPLHSVMRLIATASTF